VQRETDARTQQNWAFAGPLQHRAPVSATAVFPRGHGCDTYALDAFCGELYELASDDVLLLVIMPLLFKLCQIQGHRAMYSSDACCVGIREPFGHGIRTIIHDQGRRPKYSGCGCIKHDLRNVRGRYKFVCNRWVAGDYFRVRCSNCLQSRDAWIDRRWKERRNNVLG